MHIKVTRLSSVSFFFHFEFNRTMMENSFVGVCVCARARVTIFQ